MIVKKVEFSIIPFRTNLIVEADEDEHAIFFSLIGKRLYYIEKGKRLKIRVPSSWLKVEGDKIELSSLVDIDDKKFNWKILN